MKGMSVFSQVPNWKLRNVKHVDSLKPRVLSTEYFHRCSKGSRQIRTCEFMSKFLLLKKNKKDSLLAIEYNPLDTV